MRDGGLLEVRLLRCRPQRVEKLQEHIFDELLKGDHRVDGARNMWFAGGQSILGTAATEDSRAPMAQRTAESPNLVTATSGGEP